MNEPGPRHRSPRLTGARWASGLALGLALHSCVMPGDEGPSGQDRRARTLFEDLISRGHPVNDASAEFDSAEGGSFRNLEEQYADRPHPSDPAGGRLPDSGARPEGDALDLFADLVDAAGEAEPSERPMNPYQEFGANIIWYPAREGETERLIMKP